MKIETLYELNTEQPADTVEWCTHPLFPHHFIYGTYQLEESETDFSKAPTCTYLVNTMMNVTTRK